MNEQQAAQLNREEKSRTEYSARNTTVAMIARVIAILLGFCTRVVFTHTLSEEYVGINGLFTDILNVLALSELGIGTAITYALYKPVAEKDIEKQKALMQLYKKLYRIVAAVVLAAGLLIVPFLDVLIKNRTQVEHITLLYLMYLANSVISYLMIYKKTLIDAHQLSYIGVVYHTIFLILQNVLQMIVLVTTKNFVLFLTLLLVCTLLNNIALSCRANRMYPYLKDKQVAPLTKTEKKEISQNVRAMLMHKVGDVVVNNTDNLLLSSLVGIVSVGIYSNYFLIIGSVRQVLNQAFQGITASVGNLGVEESNAKVKRVFEASFFIGQWMFGFAAICLYELLTPFVGMSFGQQYIFSAEITLVLCLNFYFTGMRQATLVFRDSLGLFWYDRFKSLAEAIINLVVSVVLGYYHGVIGIFIGTLCSTLATSFWVEPYMLYKHRLKAPVKEYFFKYFGYSIITGLTWWLTDILCRQFTGGVFRQFVLRMLCCILVPNLIFLLVYCRSKAFVYVIKKLKKLWKKKKAGTEAETEGVAFSKEEQNLFAMLRNSLLGKADALEALTDAEWKNMLRIAKMHGVRPTLYSEACEKELLPEALRAEVQSAANQTVLQQYRLLFLSSYLTKLLAEQNIASAILKGVTIGAYYPVPELRKSGDVDLLLMNPEELERVKQIFLQAGLRIKEEQAALHHVSFSTSEGIEVELHTMLAEPFDNEKTNQMLQKLLAELKGQVVTEPVMGLELPVLPGAYYAFELLIHMLQHFLRSGFGLRLLCDWVMFWQKPLPPDEHQKYLELVEQMGLKGFSDMVTLACIRFLGLQEALVEWMDLSGEYQIEAFMREILDAEEFGKSNNNRMVVLRGTGFSDYVREFHHQMRLNYPKAGRCFVFWPFLWVATLVRFMRNNKNFRKTATWDILKEASRRSRIMKEIRLFK
ncbi:MAG: nucleotidyltransferase family protein [Lachnospiraceae bacterium]|nr:nucleotidyltransferase family protein [Lachnospiraceae bacterium]